MAGHGQRAFDRADGDHFDEAEEISQETQGEVARVRVHGYVRSLGPGSATSASRPGSPASQQVTRCTDRPRLQLEPWSYRRLNSGSIQSTWKRSCTRMPAIGSLPS